MLPKNLFRRPQNPLEDYDRIIATPTAAAPDDLCVSCPECRLMILTDELIASQYVCPKCGRHFRLGARQRIALLADENSFLETDAEMSSVNPLGFPDYDNKIKSAQLNSSEPEGVLTGTMRIHGIKTCVYAMNPYFMMGSMGVVVGEKITRLFERATKESLPVIGFTVSGGARIQEGILSLMQMAKTSGAVLRHGESGGLYIAVLTDPTTGGVTASFAMEADYTLAEPGALIGFAGPRVIEQTIRQKLPEGFQRAEFLLSKGFVDRIVDRRAQKDELAQLLRLHGMEAADERV